MSASPYSIENSSPQSPVPVSEDGAPAVEVEPRLPAQRRVGLTEALRRYPLLVVLPAAVLAAFGVAAGVARKPTYTATAQVAVVEPTTPNAAELPGVVQASQVYSASASRLITATAITATLARRFHTTTSAVTRELSATPIPQSAVIKVVVASRRSRSYAVALANSAANLFASYATAQAQDPAAANTLLHEFQAASARYRVALARQKDLEALKSASSVAQVRAAAATEAAQLRQQTLGVQYRTAIEANANAPQVTPLLAAHGAGNNRNSNIQIFLFAGILAGLVIGVALALLRANGRRPPAKPRL